MPRTVATPQQLAVFLQSMSDRQLLTLITNPEMTGQFADNLWRKYVEEPAVEGIKDEDAPEELKGYLPKWRKLAETLGYEGVIVWKVRLHGYTLQHHVVNAEIAIPDMKHSIERRGERGLSADTPLRLGEYFLCIPRYAKGVGNNTLEEDKKLRQEIALAHGFKKNSFRFGQANQLFAILHAIFLKGEHTPIEYIPLEVGKPGNTYTMDYMLHVRSDTCLGQLPGEEWRGSGRASVYYTHWPYVAAQFGEEWDDVPRKTVIDVSFDDDVDYKRGGYGFFFFQAYKGGNR